MAKEIKTDIFDKLARRREKMEALAAYARLDASSPLAAHNAIVAVENACIDAGDDSRYWRALASVCCALEDATDGRGR